MAEVTERSVDDLMGEFYKNHMGRKVLARFDYTDPRGDLGAPAGILMKWFIDNGLISEVHERDASTEVARVRSGEMSGRLFLTKVCDERLFTSDLSEQGVRFWCAYYGKPAMFRLRKTPYQRDLMQVANVDFDRIYALPCDTKKEEKILGRIGEAFEQWCDDGMK